MVALCYLSSFAASNEALPCHLERPTGVPPTSHYDLELIKLLVRQRRYVITKVAAWAAFALGFDEDDIVECVLALAPDMLHKTMESEKRPGMWQDVYHAELQGKTIYLKLQVEQNDGTAIVIQFKEK